MIKNSPWKLLLVHPVNRTRKGFSNSRISSVMPLGLGIVAAMTPAHWEVELIDENFEEFTFRQADLVALTGFTSNANRAYEIAAVCRKEGVHTVMGGIHASMYTAEVALYTDTVFTGEAEGAWPALIDDFESGRIKPYYDGGNVDIKAVPEVRREIYNKYPYVYDLVQTSRGCPMGCDFCSVTQMCGKTYRERDVEDVLNELEKTTRPLIFFVDDNLVNNKKGSEERAIRLFKGMIERGMRKMWYSQAAVNFTDNEEVLYWARKSGCYMILMGIEAEKPEALKDVGKDLNLKRGVLAYNEIFKKLHKYGIGILAAMIFGMESDTREDLFARRDFILKSSIDTYQITILTPLPGTRLFESLNAEKRIEINNYPADWQQYDGMMATGSSANLDREELDEIMREIWMSLYNKDTVRRKMFRTLWNTKSFGTAYMTYATSHNYGRMCLERYFDTDPDGLGKNLEWKNRKRSMYLKFTDKAIWLFYQLAWNRMVKKFTIFAR